MTCGPHAPIKYPPAPMTGVRVGHSHPDEDALDLVSIQGHIEAGALGRQRLRRWIEVEGGYSLDLVESHITQRGLVITVANCRRFAACPAALAAHLEQVGEVCAELHRHAYAPDSVAEVAYQEPFVARAVPDELEPVQMDLLVPQGDLSIDQEIRVTEIGAEHC